MIVELSFLVGRFHATAWGRHVNEAVPEWPPSPFRLLRALLDTWFRKHREIPPETLERTLEALAVPPLFFLPPARASHTRSYLAQGSGDVNDKKLVFDGFAVLDRPAKVLIGWPDLALPGECLKAAQTLIGGLNYLGRSESWIEARIVDDHEVKWNCVPLSSGPVSPDNEVVSVACVRSPETYGRGAFELPAKGRRAARKLPWFEALGWGSAEAIEHTLNRPPTLEPVFYLRRSDALSARPRPVRRPHSRSIDTVLFTAKGRVPVPLTDALHVGEQVRSNLMGSLKRVLGAEQQPPTFSGKDETGRPTKGHSHASVMALDRDGDGYIDALLVSAPKLLSFAEQHAIDGLHPVRRRSGHPLVLTPVRYGTRDELLTETQVVVSHTPFVPYRHWRLKRDGPFEPWLRQQVYLECQERGLPSVEQMELIAVPSTTRRRFRWLDFRRARKEDAPQPAFGLKLTFNQPVRAPFSIGYASHFGLGCFIALP